MSARKKKGFNPIRFIFKLIGFIILIIIAIPVVMLFLMFDFGNYQPPINDFTPDNSITFQTLVAERIDSFILEDKEAIDLSISAAQINAMVVQALISNNPYYPSDNEDGMYLINFDNFGGIRGITAYIWDDVIRVEVGVHARISFFTYRIRLRLDLRVVESTEGFEMEILRFNISNLPIKAIYGVANWALGLAGIDFTETIEDAIPIGTFDYQNLRFTLTYDEIFAMLGDEDGMISLLQMLATTEFGPDHKRLFNVGLYADDDPLVRGKLSLLLNFGLFRTNRPSYVLPHQITSEDELNQLFQGQISNMLLSSLSSASGEGLYLDLSVDLLNEILAFQLGAGESIMHEMEIDLGGEIFTLSIETPFIDITVNTFGARSTNINIFLNLSSERVNASFRSLFTLATDIRLAENGEDIVFYINAISIGDFSLEGEFIYLLLDMVQSDMISGRTITLIGFAENILQAGVEINRLVTLNNAIRLYVAPTDSDLLNTINSIKDAMNDVLANLADPTGSLSAPEFDDVRDEINNVLDQISSGEEPDMNDLLDAINSLSPEDQETFYNDMIDQLGSIPGLENLLP